jgi:molybdopterin-containing oxidoreductase family iron-sulfur binding subunit
MEKCTFCVQRIHDAKNAAKDKKVTVKDGDVKTACQESCPTNAIIFGNVNDKGTLVAKNFEDPRSYSVLEEFNAVPMVKYQTKVRNAESVKSDGKGAH